MSFKDSKEKIITANSAQIASLTADLAESVETNDNYETVDGYDYYPQYSDNKYSTVDNNKNITMDATQINITQESNSQFIPFQIPRYYDGIDLSNMTICIRYADRLNGDIVGEYPVINVIRNDTYIRFGWLIDDKLTQNAGDYIFEIRATGQVPVSDNKLVNYAWSTRPNGKINVLQGININGAIEPSDSGWMTAFEKRIINYTEDAKNAAKQAAASASSVDVDNIANSVINKVTDNFNKTSSLENYYTKSEINDQKSGIDNSLSNINSEINNVKESIQNIDGLANLDVSYNKENQKLSLLYKDSKKEVANAIIDIDSLSKLQVRYTTSDGKGVLSFYQENIEDPITSVELGSIDPSAEWISSHITPISNSINSIQKQQTEDEKKITTLTFSVEEIKRANTNRDNKIKTNEDAILEIKTSVSEIPQLKESVSQATNTVANMKQTVDGNKEAVDTLGTNFDDLKKEVDKLKENPAASEYDVNYEGSTFSWIKDGEVLKTFKIEGGGGQTTTSTLTIERITQADAIFLLGNKSVIEYTWSSVDNVGDSTGIGTAVWKVDNTTVSTSTVGQGKNSIDLTNYLKTGTNSIRLSITDSVGTLSTKTWTITIVDFKLESSFDDTLFYSDEVSFRYIPYGNINKTVHFILDGKELSSVNTSASGRQLSYVLTKQSHGAHLLKVYMTATVNNQDIKSDTIIKDVIWVNPDDRTPIIGCSMQEFTAKQYHATSINYVVYDPDHNPATVKLSVDGNTVSTLSVNRTQQIWSYKASTVGKHDLTISCRKVTKILKATIKKLDIDVEPITANLEFDFNPVGLSNNDVNRLWKDSKHPEVTLTVSDNFDWTNGGYQIDDKGDQYFCVKAGTKATVSYNLFGKDPKQAGSEFKIIFKTKNVRDASATFLSCISKSDDKPVGLEMNVHEAYIKSSVDNLYFPYSEEDVIEYEFDINALDTKKATTSIIMTYEDGCGGRPMIYDNTHRLHQYTPVPITIGSDDCDVCIYRMKAYSAALTDSDILANYIADARDSDEMVARYERNQIYDENNTLTPDSVARACPNVRVIKIEAPYFTNDKKDFVKGTSVECIYKNGDPILDNWKFNNAYHAGQGTTSNEYGFAARNMDLICCADGVHQINSKIPLDTEYKTELILGDGTKYSDGTGKITLTRNSVPNNWLNIKTNVASSEMSNNALLQKRYNDYLPYSTPASRRDSKIKNSMEFVNCVVFLRETNTDISTHREFSDNEWHFYSLGNIGDSKKADVTRAYDPDDMNEFCIEISDNTLPNSAFQTGVTNPDGTMKYPISKAEWKAGNAAYDNLYNNWDGSFEFRYDCCGDTKDGSAISTDAEKEKIRTKNRQIWRDFYEFVITSSDDDFKAHISDWMIKDALLYMYLFTLRYTMIDNRAKNIFPHWAKHYISQTEASTLGEKAKYYIINDSAAAINNGYRFDFWDYDNDTGLGINNSGELTMSYGKEDTDYKTDGDPNSGYIFNAAESVIWCRTRKLMKSDLRKMYQSLPQNCFSAEHLINEFDAWQNQFPEELWRLHFERLYFRTYEGVTLPGKTEVTKTDRFLKEMMNGKKKYQRRQWERDQHFYMGSKFIHTDITSDQIMFRCNTPKDAVVKPDYTLKIVPYSDMYVSVLYGNSFDVTQVRAKAGQEYKLKTNLTNMDDTAILIYGASRIQALNDLSACYIHDNDFSKASKLKTLIIGNNTEGYQNSFLTNLNMGNNTLLDTLDVRNCPNLTGTINLSACENLISLYADGTIVTSVSFANHGKITHVHLPETINNLTFQNLKNLTDFNIASYKNLEKFICESSIFDALGVIKAAINSLKSVRVTDINWNLENTDLLKKLAKLIGEDENGSTTDHSVLTGQIHVPVIRAQELKEFIGTEEERGIWPDLEITYDSMIEQFTLTFINDDEEHTVLEVQYVDKGADGTDPVTRKENPIATPTKASTQKEDFTYKGWDGSLEKVFSNRIITAVYTSTVRKYTIKYCSKGYDGPLYTVSAPYGTIAEYKGDVEIPIYTGEESAYKFYLFKEWDNSGYVTGNKTINAIFDTCEYRDGYFNDKDLNNLSEVELYALMKMGLDASFLDDKDYMNFTLGNDCSFEDITEHVVINTPKEFDGTNYVDTGLKLFEKDKSFTLALDYVFSSNNSNNATLAQCFQGDGSNGFKLSYNSGVQLKWGTTNANPSSTDQREIIVLRHIVGEEKLYLYSSNAANNNVAATTLSAIRSPEHEYTFVLGCEKSDVGAYLRYAKGTVYWCKIWDADLGDEKCQELAAWVHETIPMEVAKYGDTQEYYLSDGSSKQANITFLAKNLLGTSKGYGARSGGWATSTMNKWLNTRLPKAISPLWKSLIKEVKVKSFNGDKANTITESNCKFYIPSIYEVDNNYNREPYNGETDNTISYMVSDENRKRAKVTTPNKYEAYYTRTPNAEQFGTDYVKTVADDGNTQNSFIWPSSDAGVLLMFSVFADRL